MIGRKIMATALLRIREASAVMTRLSRRLLVFLTGFAVALIRQAVAASFPLERNNCQGPTDGGELDTLPLLGPTQDGHNRRNRAY
jgi:hypothetical protein